VEEEGSREGEVDGVREEKEGGVLIKRRRRVGRLR
jgi:hypothetical protein